KLDRSLADKRIYPAIDIATSGTRREEKLFKAEQLDAVYALRRGLARMPPQSAMEWLIKRISATANNDILLAGLIDKWPELEQGRGSPWPKHAKRTRPLAEAFVL